MPFHWVTNYIFRQIPIGLAIWTGLLFSFGWISHRVGNLNGSYNKVLDWRVTDIYLFHTTFKKIVENRYRIQVKGSKKSCYWNGSYLLQHCDGGCFEWDRKSNGRQPRICSGALQRAAPKWWQMQMRQGSWGSANKFQMVWSIKKFFLQSFKN